MEKLLPLISFLLISTFLIAQTDAKLTSSLRDRLKGDENVEVIIVLKEQFDYSEAAAKHGKLEKGVYVYQNLTKVARESQKNLRKYFKEKQIQHQPFYIINSIYAEVNSETLYEIMNLPEVKRIHHNSYYAMMEPIEDDGSAVMRAGIPWGILNIGADSVWSEYNVRGEGVVVGGQDTGYQWNHPALKKKYRGWSEGGVDHDYNWHDAIDEDYEGHSANGNPCGYSTIAPCDDHAHGSHTMGTMIGDDEMGEQIGVAPGARWIGARNMERGGGYFRWYMECFEWFLAPYRHGENPEIDGRVDKAPHVINNSWTCPDFEGCDEDNFELMGDLVSILKASGIVVVVSNGNDGGNCETVFNPPGFYEDSFSVGATNSNDTRAGFSSRGPVTYDGSNRIKPDVSAPGVGVRSANNSGGYYNSSGTSMAGPHVAGAVALIISAIPTMAGDVEGIENLLESTARPKTDTWPCGGLAQNEVPNNDYGYGIINVMEAIRQGLIPLPLRLLSFSGHALDNSNLLQWRTADEKNLSHFEIERSREGLHWERIMTKTGTKQATSVNEYVVIDNKPAAGKNYYRLKQVDKDNSAIYSDAILIYRKTKTLDFTIYPNPSGGTLYVKTSDDRSLLGYKLEIFNVMGQSVKHIDLNSYKVELNEASGLYFYRLIDTDGIICKTGKIILE